MIDSPYSIPLSALQHYLYCPRQCALIHVEYLWADNQFTAEGNAFHERADSGLTETRGLKKTLRTLHIASEHWGIHGIADVVELVYDRKGGRPAAVTPVEYKVGKPKQHRADEVQVCAQALCLEEIFEVPVAEGFLFYGKTQNRHVVSFDEELRALTTRVIQETRAVLTGQVTPPPQYSKACKACSLMEDCLPAVCRERRQGAMVRVNEDFDASLAICDAEEL